MIRELRVSHVYVDNQTWDRLVLLCEEFGWHKKTILRRCIHGFFQRYDTFYADAAILDARSRQISEQTYFEILRDQTPADLPPYPKAGFLQAGASPLADYPLIPKTKEFRRPYNDIALSAYNYVLFRVALMVENVPQNQLIGKMILKHFDDDWAVYEARMAKDRAGEFIGTEKKSSK
jgi:hypothetical protein